MAAVRPNSLWSAMQDQPRGRRRRGRPPNETVGAFSFGAGRELQERTAKMAGEDDVGAIINHMHGPHAIRHRHGPSQRTSRTAGHECKKPTQRARLYHHSEEGGCQNCTTQAAGSTNHAARSGVTVQRVTPREVMPQPGRERCLPGFEKDPAGRLTQ